MPSRRLTYNSYGMPGLVDMPSSQSGTGCRAELFHFASGQEPTQYVNVPNFPRLTGAFRYSSIERPGSTLYDRSFDLRYRLLDETDRRPAIAVGLQDFIGTDVYPIVPRVYQQRVRTWARLSPAARCPISMSLAMTMTPATVQASAITFMSAIWRAAMCYRCKNCSPPMRGMWSTWHGPGLFRIGNECRLLPSRRPGPALCHRSAPRGRRANLSGRRPQGQGGFGL